VAPASDYPTRFPFFFLGFERHEITKGEAVSKCHFHPPLPLRHRGEGRGPSNVIIALWGFRLAPGWRSGRGGWRVGGGGM